jgi:hypothetical protein
MPILTVVETQSDDRVSYKASAVTGTSSSIAMASDQRRNKLISIRISQELYDLVRIASHQLAHGSVSDFAREAIEDAILQRPAATERVVTRHLSTLIELAGELNQSVKSLKSLIKNAR